jgi:carnitine O-acetyltransferase
MTPKDIHEAAANMLHGTYNLRSEDNLNNLVDYQAGTCTNRWYDKLQVIVCKDGRAGINFEHSAIDGHTALRFVSDIFADNVVSFAQSITQTVYSDRHMFPPLIQAHLRRASLEHPQLVAPRKLTFELPQCVLDKIYYAETSLSDQIVASDTFVLEFTGYGKNFIVRNKMSPDSYVQLSMQLAYYRLYGKIVSQYEPVLTKAFYHGRTEAMRTATEKAALFCKKWLDPSATNEEKLEALRVATQYHSAGIKLASTGQGIERHLFALKCIADKNGIPTPDFFSSEAYTRLNHTILSTSNCGNPSLKCELSVAVFSVVSLLHFHHSILLAASLHLSLSLSSVWIRTGCTRWIRNRLHHTRQWTPILHLQQASSNKAIRSHTETNSHRYGQTATTNAFRKGLL